MTFSHLKFLVMLLPGSLILFNCNIEEPAAPSWETTLRLPLISKNIPMSDIVDDEEYLHSDGNGVVYFNFSKKIDAFPVEDKLKLTPQQNEYFSEIGVIRLNLSEQKNVAVTLTDLYPDAPSLEGETVIVPPFSIDPILKNLSPFPDFKWIQVETGKIAITLTNQLDITLGKSFQLNLYDISNSELINGIAFQKLIYPGESITGELDLSGKRISNNLRIEIYGESVGSQGHIIQVDPAGSLSINCEVSELLVIEAFASMPKQEFSGTSYMHITDSIAISHAKIRQGLLQFAVTKSFPMSTTLEINIPALSDQSGQQYTETIILSNSNTTERSIRLDEFTLQPGTAHIGNQKIEMNWRATIDQSNEMILIDQHDFFQVNTSTSEIIFNEVSGVLKTVKLEIAPLREKIEVFDELQSIQLQNARVNVSIKSGINFPAETDLIVKGINDNGDIANLSVKKKIPAASPNSIETTQIILDKSNSNIIEFLNNLPQDVEIYGTVKLGDGVSEGTVTQNDFIEAMLEITAPLTISLKAQSLETPVDTVNIDSETQEQIKNNLLFGDFFATVNNSIPLGASIYLNISKTDTSVYSKPNLIIGPIEIAAAMTDENGMVNSPVQQSSNFTLTKEDLELFENQQLFMGLKIIVPGTKNQIVTITSSNFINVNAHTIMKLNLTKN